MSEETIQNLNIKMRECAKTMKMLCDALCCNECILESVCQEESPCNWEIDDE